MSDLISRAALFNALANANDKGEIFAVIQSMPDATMCGYNLDELFTLARAIRLCGVEESDLHRFVTDLVYMANIMLQAELKSLKHLVYDSVGGGISVTVTLPSAEELVTEARNVGD